MKLQKQLRGGGCGSAKINIIQPKPTQPNNIVENIKHYTQIICDKANLAYDKYSQQEVMVAIQWFNYNKEHIDALCQDQNSVQQSFSLIVDQIVLLLKNSVIYARTSGFIQLQIVSICNDLLRIVFIFLVNRPDCFLEDNTKLELLEYIQEISQENDQVWKTGFEYEVQILKSCLENCRSNSQKGQEILIDFVTGLIKSALSMSPSGDLIKSLIEGGKFLGSILYTQIKNNVKKFEIHSYFETLKWMIIRSIQNQQIQISYLKALLIDCYEKYVQNSKNWVIHFCWQNMIADIILYRPIIKKDQLNQQHISWNQLVNQKILLPMSYNNKIEAKVSNLLAIQSDTLKIDQFQIYQKLDFFQQSILEDKIIQNNSIMNYYLQFKFEDGKSSYDYQFLFEKRNSLIKNFQNLWSKYLNFQLQQQNQDHKMEQLQKFNKNQQSIEQENYLKRILVLLIEIQHQSQFDNEKCKLFLMNSTQLPSTLSQSEIDQQLEQSNEILEWLLEKIILLLEKTIKEKFEIPPNSQVIQFSDLIYNIQNKWTQISTSQTQFLKLTQSLPEQKIANNKFQFKQLHKCQLNLLQILVNQIQQNNLTSQQEERINIEQVTAISAVLDCFLMVSKVFLHQIKRLELGHNEFNISKFQEESQINNSLTSQQQVLRLLLNQFQNLKISLIKKKKNEQNSFQQFQRLLQGDSALIAQMRETEEISYFILQVQSKVIMLQNQSEIKTESQTELENLYESKIHKIKENIVKLEGVQKDQKMKKSDSFTESLFKLIESYEDLNQRLENLTEQFYQLISLLKQSEQLQTQQSQSLINNQLVEVYNKKIDELITSFQKAFSCSQTEIHLNFVDQQLEKLFEFFDFCQDYDSQKLSEINQVFSETQTIVKEADYFWQDQCYKIREGVFMSIIKMQSMRQDDQMQKYCQWAIKQMWIKEKDLRVRSLMKNQELIEVQQKLYSQNLSSFSSLIKEEVNQIMNRMKQIEADISVESEKEKKTLLLQSLEHLNEELDDYISGVSEMSQKLDISLIFLKEIQKQLKVINQKIQNLKQSVDQIDINVQRLVGKHWTEMLEIRRKKVQQKNELQEMNEMYVPISLMEEEQVNSLDKIIDNFLIGDFDVLLISGQAGCGKSTAAQKIEDHIIKNNFLWITLFAYLPAITNPSSNLIEKILESELYQFDKIQIREMKEDLMQQKLVLILDNYDEAINRVNLYQSNGLKFVSQNLKLILTVRKEMLNQMGYQAWFYAQSIRTMKEAEFINLNDYQEYIQQYCLMQIKRFLIEFFDCKQEFRNIWQKAQQYIFERVDLNKSDKLFTSQEAQRFLHYLQGFTEFKTSTQSQRLESDLLSIPSQLKIQNKITQLGMENILTTPFMLHIALWLISKLEPNNWNEQFIQNYKKYKILKLESEQIISQNRTLVIDEGILQIEAIQKLEMIKLKETQNNEIQIDEFTQQVISSLQTSNYTQFDFYERFTNHYYEVQLQTKRQKQFDFDNAMIDIKLYSQQLSVDMTIQGLSKLDYKVKGQLKYKQQQDWMDQYFEESEYKKMILSCSLIIKNGSTYYFKHKQIQDFYVANQLLDELSNQPDILLNSQNLSQDHFQGTIVIVKDKLFQISNLKKKLIENIKLSQNNSIYQRIASNSIFLLGVMNEFLGDLSLQNIFISDTNLCGLNFCSSDLSNSNFTNVNIDQCNFNDVNLSQVKWQNVKCREKPFLQGHTDYIRQIDNSGDGKHIVSVGDDNNIIIWNIQDYKQELILQGHTDIIQTVQYLIDGKTIVSGGNDKIIRVWNSENGKLLYQLEGHTDSITTIVINNFILASGSNDKTIRLWDMNSQKLINILENNEVIRKLQFYNANQLISICQKIIIWDMANFQQVKVIDQYLEIHCLAVYNKAIAIGLGSGNIVLIEIQLILEGHKRQVDCLAFSKKGQLLASGSEDQTVRLWEVKNGNQIAIFQGHSHFVTSVIFSIDDKTIFSSSYDKLIRQWNVGATIQGLKQDGHEKYISSVKFSSDGKILASSSLDGTIKLWDYKTFKLLKNLKGHSDMVWCLAFSPICMILASGSEDNTIRFWDVHFYIQLKVLNVDSSTAINYSQDGKLLASGGIEQCIKLWNTENYELLKDFNVHNDTITQLLFDKDFLISSSKDMKINIINIKTYQQIQVLKHHKSILTNILIQKDSLYSLGYDSKIMIYNLKENQLSQTIDAHSSTITSIIFDNNKFYTGGDDNMVKIWNQDFDLLQTFHLSDQVKCLALHQNILAIGCYDGSINFLDVQKFIIVKIFARQCLLQAQNCKINNSTISNNNESLTHLFLQKGAQIVAE